MRRSVLPWLLSLVSFTVVAADTDFVGSEKCAQCHTEEVAAWRGSHHDLAMKDADAKTVVRDFSGVSLTAHGVTSTFFQRDDGYFVRTDGPDGKLQDYQVRYTFGWFPLQQYLVEFPRGRFQALSVAWDSRPAEQGGQRWFHLYPHEPMDHQHALHWTGREQTWNYQCAECHSTNLQKHYDLASDSYRTTWSEIDVACEACHGPGAAHLAWAERHAAGDARGDDDHFGLQIDLSGGEPATWSIDPATEMPKRSVPRDSRAQSTLCARCHSRRGQLWLDYEYGKPLGDTHRLALLDEQLYFPDGQIKDEVYVYGSFIQSKMFHAGVSCSDCHEPHSLQLRAQGNALCTRCHQADRFDAPAHHHHGTDSPGAACTACHMPQRTYMVIDDRADHSLRVPRPDLSVRLGTPNACNSCHTEQDAAWAATAVAQWFPEGRQHQKHFGDALFAAQQNAPDAASQLLALAGDGTQPGIARASAVDRLSAFRAADQLFTIRRLLSDDDELIRRAAVAYLDGSDPRSQIDLAWPLLDDPVRSVRVEAARVLAPMLRQRVPDQFRTQLERGVAEYAETLQATAERPESQLNQGLLSASIGDAPGAEKAYRDALRLDPGFVPGYVNLADLFRATGRDTEGETLLQSALNTVGDNADLYYALGLLEVRKQQLPQALPHLEKAASMAPERARYSLVYALALRGLGEEQRAQAVLQQALKVHPDDAEIRAALEPDPAQQ